MPLSSSQLRWGRLLLILLGALALLYRFWPLPPNKISSIRPPHDWVWDEIPIIENQTLGVSIYFDSHNGVLKLTTI